MQDLWSARKATVCRDLCRGSGMAKTHNLTSFSWKERKYAELNTSCKENTGGELH